MNLTGRNSVVTALLSALLLIIVILVGSTAIGCSSGPPDKVVASFAVAITNRDIDKAKTFCTERFSSTYLTGMQAAMGAIPTGFNFPGGENPSVADMRSVFQTSVEGDTARVWIPQADYMKYVLVKEGSNWKIDSIEVDMESIMDEARRMGFDPSNMPNIPGRPGS